jgi:hypothetical protein
LINKAKDVDPQLAESLTEKALIWSKTVWATPVSLVVSWVVSHYALGWDADTSALVTGVVTWGVVTGVRYISRAPIGGILSVPATPVTATPGAPKL